MRERTKPWRAFWPVALLLVLALRALMPAGFMVAPSQDGLGKVAMVLCTGSGPTTALIDLGGPSKQAPGKRQSDAPCPFTVAPALAAEDTIVAVATPPRPIPAPLAIPPSGPTLALLAPPPPARGPPIV